jgi:hypothetical protein
VSIRFCPHRSPDGTDTSHEIPRRVAPRTLACTEPELWRPSPIMEMALNSRGPGDPSEGSTEVDAPPQATSRASGSPSRFEAGVGAPASCIVKAEDPRRTLPREGHGFS